MSPLKFNQALKIKKDGKIFRIDIPMVKTMIACSIFTGFLPVSFLWDKIDFTCNRLLVICYKYKHKANRLSSISSSFSPFYTVKFAEESYEYIVGEERQQVISRRDAQTLSKVLKALELWVFHIMRIPDDKESKRGKQHYSYFICGKNIAS